MAARSARIRSLSSAKHPYLSGNFAPIHRTRPLTPCIYTGTIPDDLIGGQYVRNGGNPVSNEDLGRDAHWFDGDGMLSGVLFARSGDFGQIEPAFVNQYILTDCLISSVTSPTLYSPILPSIATLVNPASSLIHIILSIFRSLFLVILSHLPGSQQAIKKISVANTHIVYHDGRALATCESGPPIRVQLPNLETVGWFDGVHADGEAGPRGNGNVFGGEGLIGFMKEWTTGHPKVDPLTKEMLVYHCTFAPPYVHYAVLPTAERISEKAMTPALSKLMNIPVPKCSGGKMMHDFGVSRHHTVILDLPLSLDPLNLLKNQAVVSYDAHQPSRFGVFPRRNPSAVRWFETKASCIFHTANTWDETDANGQSSAVNMLACRLTSAALVFSAGNIAAPQPTAETVEEVKKAMPFFERYDHDDAIAYDEAKLSTLSAPDLDPFEDLEAPIQEEEPLVRLRERAYYDSTYEIEEDQCRLYYYRFALNSAGRNQISHQFALSAIPFEFPTLHPQREMVTARYIYGCSTSTASFGSALGRAVKIDVLAKIDVRTLLQRAQHSPPKSVTGCVDQRTVPEILAQDDVNDPVRCFRMPEGWYAQEARFVPRAGNNPAPVDDPARPYDDSNEDDGYLLFYAFDESQLKEDGECPDNAASELWILDAKSMRDVICRIKLPQRVPYGLHGNWFSEEQILDQRAVERFRTIPTAKKAENVTSWDQLRQRTIAWLG